MIRDIFPTLFSRLPPLTLSSILTSRTAKITYVAIAALATLVVIGVKVIPGAVAHFKRRFNTRPAAASSPTFSPLAATESPPTRRNFATVSHR